MHQICWRARSSPSYSGEQGEDTGGTTGGTQKGQLHGINPAMKEASGGGNSSISESARHREKMWV